jgi:acetyl/propionyl-CoA carboxylase alpha subunit
MRSALRAYPVLGTRTNIPFLVRLMDHPAFQANRVHTGFLDSHMGELTATGDVPPAAIAAAAIDVRPGAGAPTIPADSAPTADPWTTLSGWGR